MPDNIEQFEEITRRVQAFTDPQRVEEGLSHPFELRNIHAKLPSIVRELFDNGHFAQATFEAYKYLDREIQRLSSLDESGFKLMMQAFGSDAPMISLTEMANVTERDEQKGYQFIFAGSMLAIRNPRGHEHSVDDDPDSCLDHLGLVSMLLRRLADSGFK